MKLSERIDILSYLGAYLLKGSDQLDAEIQKTYFNNRWFTKENTRAAIDVIAQNFLNKDLLENWLANYPISERATKKRVGLIPFGNIPLVGFHDLLSVFACGHISKIKLTEEDKFLMPHFIKIMGEVNDEVLSMFEVSERLTDLDAVIANGNNKSLHQFRTYFGKYPNLIREQKNTVAVLNGQESKEDLEKLGDDIFKNFGLGRRNVSKLYVPEDYDFEPLLEILHEHRDLVHHNKYKNNFDYNYTLLILNNIPIKSNGCILMTEDNSLQSRIAQLHYEFYKNEEDLASKLIDVQDKIENIVSNPVPGLAVIPFGKAHLPELSDYADGVDTISFLTGLN